MSAYAQAEEAAYEGHDTADVIQRFTHQIVAAVAGSRTTSRSPSPKTST